MLGHLESMSGHLGCSLSHLGFVFVHLGSTKPFREAQDADLEPSGEHFGTIWGAFWSPRKHFLEQLWPQSGLAEQTQVFQCLCLKIQRFLQQMMHQTHVVQKWPTLRKHAFLLCEMHMRRVWPCKQSDSTKHNFHLQNFTVDLTVRNGKSIKMGS